MAETPSSPDHHFNADNPFEGLEPAQSESHLIDAQTSQRLAWVNVAREWEIDTRQNPLAPIEEVESAQRQTEESMVALTQFGAEHPERLVRLSEVMRSVFEPLRQKVRLEPREEAVRKLQVASRAVELYKAERADLMARHKAGEEVSAALQAIGEELLDAVALREQLKQQQTPEEP